MSSAPQPEEDVIDTVEPEPADDRSVQAADDAAPASDAPTEDAPEATEEQASAEVMALLSEHVPLALLADLALPEGPASPTILEDEGLPEDPWWEQ